MEVLSPINKRAANKKAFVMQKLKLAEEEYSDKKQEVFKPSLLFWTALHRAGGKCAEFRVFGQTEKSDERWRK